MLAAMLAASGPAAADPAGDLFRNGNDAAAAARMAPPGVSVTMVSSPNLTLDSNRPCTDGPTAAYVSFRVTNTSGAPLSNLSATLSGFGAGITLSGGQVATQYFGSLAAGASKYLYWYVTYPCTFGVTTNLTVSVFDGTGGSTVGSGTVTTFSMISAQAGGVLVSALLGPGAVVGQTISFDVTYDFGGADAGTTYNLQPAGNPGFAAGCFQMVRSEVVGSNILAIPVGNVNQIYFTATQKQTGPNQQATMRYFFKYLCAGVSSQARAYSNQLSGTQLKYSSNFTTFVGPTLPGATEPFDVVKTASPAQLPAGGAVTYTVVVTNPSGLTSEVDSIVDQLPVGVSFTGFGPGSQVTAANSGSYPSVGATGRIVFRGTPGTSYSLPAGGTLTLVYTATVGNTPGRYVNSASGFAGITNVGTGMDTVVVGTANLSVVKTGSDSTVVGDTAVYVVTTSNLGPNSAFDVVVVDSLPPGVTFVSASRGGTFGAGKVTWPSVLTLANGASLVDTVRVQVPATLGALLNRGRAGSNTYDPTAADNDGTAPASQKTTQVVGPIVVTPDGLPSPAPRLPGTGYSQAFLVDYRGGANADVDLLADVAGSPLFLQVDSIRGPGLTAGTDSARVPFAARTTVTYHVWYTVPAGDTAVNVERLTARPVTYPALPDSGWVELRRVFPQLTLAKSVSPNTVVSPGTELTYEMQFSNEGEYEAVGVHVTDVVPPEVFFKLGSPGQSLPGALGATVTYSDDGGATWTYVPVSGACGAPAGHDGCVQRVRWTLTGPLPAGAASSTGTVTFQALIR